MMDRYQDAWLPPMLLLRCAGFVCVALLATSLSWAQAGAAAKRAFDDAANFPWYDSGTDALQSVPVPDPGRPPPIREWQWPDMNGPNWNWNWSPRFGQAVGSIFEALIWIFLIGLLVTVVMLLIRAYLEGEGFGFGGRATVADATDNRSDADRIENLPFEVKAAQTDLLSEARRLRAEGRFGDAIVYLFSYQLVQLDKHHFIRLTRGKTNRQYLFELAQRQDMRRLLGKTMVAFEDFFFGDHSIEEDRFESLWNQLDEFHGIVSPGHVS